MNSDERSELVGGECPPWCEGCGPDDPMHRTDLTTIGSEGGGWISLHVLLDRFRRREPMLRIDTTRYGPTQSIVLTVDQVGRFLLDLARGHEILRETRTARRAVARSDGD